MNKNATVEIAHTRRVYQSLFHPTSIVVIGASGDPLKPGGRVLKSIKENGYGGRLWAVNPKATDILGLPTYPSIAALPKNLDLAIIAIPAPFVLPAVQELAVRKTGAVIVLTSGFGEKNAAGREAELQMKSIADAAGMALIGPNCSGFLTATYKGKFAGIVPKLPGGVVDFISGSGATVDYVMECAESRGLSFGTVINLGNSVQLGVEDLLGIYDQNYCPDCARILMLYMESVKKPNLLLLHARSLAAKGCALIGIKSGATEAGSRAAASHTGAMASSDTAVEALFTKAGIIRVQSRESLIDVACILRATRGRLTGNRVCVVTDAGGPGVMLADELARQGLSLPRLTEPTRDKLERILPPESSMANPIDALPSRSAEQIKAIIRVLGEYERDRIDIIAVLIGDSGLSDNAAIYREISEAMRDSPIPIIPMLSSLTSCRDKISDFINRGNVFFSDEVALGRALGILTRWLPPEDAGPAPDRYNLLEINQAIGQASGILPPETVRLVLRAAGFLLPEQIEIINEAQISRACRQLAFPLAMKIIGPLHKTDVGGVILDIVDEGKALEAWTTLMSIPGAKAVLLQSMVDGPEVILGASREGDFGHLVMFGLGGIYTEVLKDVQFALAPLSEGECLRMIRGIRSHALLAGVRGKAGVDTMVLADLLRRLGRLVIDFPRIKEIDLNPIKGFGSKLCVVDARIIVDTYDDRNR